MVDVQKYFHTIGGVEYQVRFAFLKTHRGDCSRPDAKIPEIRIKAGMSEPETLEVICHEFLHAAFWCIAEENIEDSAASLAGLLLKMGYART